MAQGRSAKIISMIQWIRTGRLSIKNSLSLGGGGVEKDGDGAERREGHLVVGRQV